LSDCVAFSIDLVDNRGVVTRTLPRDGDAEEFRGDQTVGPRSKVWTRDQRWRSSAKHLATSSCWCSPRPSPERWVEIAEQSPEGSDLAPSRLTDNRRRVIQKHLIFSHNFLVYETDKFLCSIYNYTYNTVTVHW